MTDVEVHIDLEGQVRTLGELHYLLGVADETRWGALRFRWRGEEVFQAPVAEGVPTLNDDTH